MLCPRDKTALVPRRIARFDASLCPACNGIFVVLDSANAHDLAARLKLPESTSSPGILVSPASGIAMIPFKHRGIELDLCPTRNGIWIDHGELAKILASPPRRQKQEPAPTDYGDVILYGPDAFGEVLTSLPSAFDCVGDFVGDIFDSW